MTSEEKIDIIEKYVDSMLEKAGKTKHQVHFIAGVLEGMIIKFAKTDDDIKEIQRMTK